jgi:L-alanine-DL-glutamate epimerase-like enolase superfamily enzyme
MPVQSELRTSPTGVRLHSTIEDIAVSAYTIPTDFPESDGTLAWDKTTIVVVEISCDGERGVGYTYADPCAASLIGSKLADEIRGKNAMDIARCHQAMLIAIRNLGRQGIVAAAISAVDIALWDLKARLLALPLFRLLGAVRTEIPIYGSGGFTSYSIEQLQSQLGGWASSSISMVKMKIGRRPHEDVARVRAARQAIGQDTQLSWMPTVRTAGSKLLALPRDFVISG